MVTSSTPREAFRTHANYLRAFAHLADPRRISSPRNSFRAIQRRVLNSQFLPTARSQAPDLAQARASLHNAWGTELLLTLGEQLLQDEEVIRLSNNWNVVQGYYVLYHAVQAVVAAKGQPRPASHAKTQEWHYQLFAKRQLSLPPWTLAFGSNGALNTPAGTVINDRVHSWTTCDDETSWGLACKALRTTREDAVPERMQKQREQKRSEKRKEWNREESKRLALGRRPREMPTIFLPRLTVSEKEKIEANLRPYTLMDYMYRLRLRSNYEDSAMFTDGPEDNRASTQVRRDVSLLCGSTSLIAELIVGRLVGEEKVRGWAEDWERRSSPPDWSGGLIARRDLIV